MTLTRVQIAARIAGPVAIVFCSGAATLAATHGEWILFTLDLALVAVNVYLTRLNWLRR